MTLLLSHAAQLLTLRNTRDSSGPRRGPQMLDLGTIEDGAVLIANGKIAAVGTTDEVGKSLSGRSDVEEIDCRGKVVLPGFVDSHTHPVFTAPRLVDFEKRIAGANYEEIAAAGGGIRSSLNGVRNASTATLADHVLRGFRAMASQGTTTVEAKSGYGLSVEAEMKSLEAIRDAAKQWNGTAVATLLGAHVVPPEFHDDPDEYVRLICEQMIPQVAEQKLAEFVDVFCERGAFTTERTQRVFQCAAEHRLGLRAHACQLTTIMLDPLIRFDPASLDHMDFVDDSDLPLLASSDTIATLLPAVNYFLGHSTFPPARKFIDSGVAVALATDYNPGTAPTPSMPFVLSAACTRMNMLPAEAITAATYNGACALRLQHRKGSLEPGKDADLAIFDVEDYRELGYWFGVNRCWKTIAFGRSD